MSTPVYATKHNFTRYGHRSYLGRVWTQEKVLEEGLLTWLCPTMSFYNCLQTVPHNLFQPTHPVPLLSLPARTVWGDPSSSLRAIPIRLLLLIVTHGHAHLSARIGCLPAIPVTHQPANGGYHGCSNRSLASPAPLSHPANGGCHSHSHNLLVYRSDSCPFSSTWHHALAHLSAHHAVIWFSCRLLFSY